MKIYIPNYDPNGLGGGWTFLRNFIRATSSVVQLSSLQDCDVMFICGPTMASRDEVKKAQSLGKKIVLRVDNIPEDYRNRGTAISRLKDYSKISDAVVYQSEWAREYVMGLTGVDGVVIYNGVNFKIFNDKERDQHSKNILYVRSSTNESKRWQEAKYIFREMWLEDKELQLLVVGNFADYIKLYGDDFVGRYNLGCFDEFVTYIGQIKDVSKMADIMRRSREILIPFYNDACSNTVLEAIACGCKINTCHSGNTGGTPEILDKDLDINMDRMGKEYLGLFDLVLQ